MGNRNHSALSESVLATVVLRSALTMVTAVSHGECLVGFSQMSHHSTSGSSSIPRLAQTPWSQYSPNIPAGSGSWALQDVPDPRGAEPQRGALVQHAPWLTRDLLVNLVGWKVMFANMKKFNWMLKFLAYQIHILLKNENSQVVQKCAEFLLWKKSR